MITIDGWNNVYFVGAPQLVLNGKQKITGKIKGGPKKTFLIPAKYKPEQLAVVRVVVPSENYKEYYVLVVRTAAETTDAWYAQEDGGEHFQYVLNPKK